MYDRFSAKGVNVTNKDQNSNYWLSMLVSIAPFALLLGLWFFLLRQMQSGGNKAMSFGKSRARLLSMQQKKITFKDVAGVDEAKEELKEIIEFLREAQKFQRLGGRIPKGVLLVGPPGTGKTLLARAVAGEANVPFFSISGSDFVEMFVGVGASRVRDLFEQGKKNAPCIIFIDEIDAVGRHRGAGLGGGHDEREQTLNQLLVEMDGFESNDGVILIAATNRPDVLDPALLRPGRFDRRVIVDRPDIRGREEVLRVHSKKVPMAEDVNLNVLARGTPGFSGADLANMVNEAALTAARYNRKSVHMYRLRSGEGQGADGRGAQVHAALRRRQARHRLPRGRSRAGRGEAQPRRPAAQGDHHSARHGAGRDHAPARGRQAHRDQGLSRHAACHPDGRTLRRRDLHAPQDDGSGQRHRPRHRACAQDGVRVRHERPWAADLRQEGAGSVPGPRHCPGARLLRRHRQADRRGGSRDSSTRRTSRRTRFSKTTRTSCTAWRLRCWNARRWTRRRSTCSSRARNCRRSSRRWRLPIPGPGDGQKVVKPEAAGRKPGFPEGQPSPA